MFSSRVGFFSSAAVITVTGGTLTTSGDYSIRTFNANGNLVISGGSLAIEYLMVAGGGASGGDTEYSGGGGAGGLLTGSTTLAAGTYAITRGAAGVYTSGANGGNGGNTTFNGQTAYGGGGGGRGDSGRNGGSGGGGGGRNANHDGGIWQSINMRS